MALSQKQIEDDLSVIAAGTLVEVSRLIVKYDLPVDTPILWGNIKAADVVGKYVFGKLSVELAEKAERVSV